MWCNSVEVVEENQVQCSLGDPVEWEKAIENKTKHEKYCKQVPGKMNHVILNKKYKLLQGCGLFLISRNKIMGFKVMFIKVL